MGKYANTEKEAMFLELVDNGTLKITKQGQVFNLKTGNEIGHVATYGYRILCRRFNGKAYYMKISRLVWLVHKNRDLDPIIQINHKDGNKLNDKLSNLEETTSQENVQHAYDTGLSIISEARKVEISNACTGHRHTNSKLTPQNVVAIKKAYSKGGITHNFLAEKYGVSQKAIFNILHDRSYKF